MKYALLNKQNQIINIIEWDGNSLYSPIAGTDAIKLFSECKNLPFATIKKPFVEYVPEQRPKQTNFQVSLKTQTKTNVQTELLTAESKNIAVKPESIVSFSVKITGVNSDGSSMADFWRRGQVKNIQGTTYLVNPIETIGEDKKDANVDVSVVADDTKDCLSVFVSGIQDETWNWSAVVDLNEILI